MHLVRINFGELRRVQVVVDSYIKGEVVYYTDEGPSVGTKCTHVLNKLATLGVHHST